MNPRVPCESQGPVVVSTPGQLGSQICLTANAGGDRYFQQTLRLVQTSCCPLTSTPYFSAQERARLRCPCPTFTFPAIYKAGLAQPWWGGMGTGESGLPPRGQPQRPWPRSEHFVSQTLSLAFFLLLWLWSSFCGLDKMAQ